MGFETIHEHIQETEGSLSLKEEETTFSLLCLSAIKGSGMADVTALSLIDFLLFHVVCLTHDVKLE